ncbi:phage holin family protein [Kamptonema cortianum]|nr:phage holin family protein [Oscillatoria laete-virens]MDK3159388.1 phage holin family protein [Kamptonema cortianum]MDL5054185.1 phage holin family protein [Oscillatoria laete-virens NRMC-F 0139]
MLKVIFHWLVTSVGVWVAAYLVPGINYDSWESLVIAALILGILNAILKPVLMLLTLPVILLTLGLFLLVINTIIFYILGWLPGFHVENFLSALFGSIIVSIVSFFFYAVAGKK